MTRLAIISDLHVGEKARRFDFKVGATRPEGVPSYLDEFQSFVKREALEADVLIVPGDIANRAHPDEYELAQTKIKEIADALKIAHSDILFVPGNHDVCWAVQQLGGQFWQSKKFLPVAEILSPAFPNMPAELFSAPYAAITKLQGIQFILVNSAHADDFHEDGKKPVPHHGSLAPESVEFLNENLEEIRKHHPNFTVLVTHHHILPMSDPDPYWKDFSMMNNSGMLLDFIADARVDLVVHGHKHWPKFHGYQNPPKPHVAVLGAGSFSAEIDESINSKVFNKFHLISLEGRDRQGNIAGRVTSWSYYAGHGWKPSNKENGIGHLTPFGHYRTFDELMDEARTAFVNLGSSGDLIEVEKLTDQISHNSYIEAETLTDIIKAVATENGKQFLVDTTSSKGYLV